MAENMASAKADESRSSKKPATQTDESSFDMDELRQLMELVNEQGFTDFEFENENIRVRLSKASGFAPIAQPAQTSGPVSTINTPLTPSHGADAPPTAAETDAGLHKITSPIVGTFYSAPGPDKEPYVKEGSKVTSESVVCIVEAMKLMNEIQAEVTGEVVKVYVENGQPVEFGQPLFGIKK